MTEIRPRRLAHRGSVDAAGFLIDLNLIDESEARRRILRLWSPGAQVYRINDSLLIRLPQSQRTPCNRAIGAPLTASGRILAALPLAEDELKSLDPRPDSVVIARGGVATAIGLQPSLLDSIEAWIDVDEFSLISVSSLGPRPAPPRIVAEPKPFDARDKLDGVPPAARGLEEFLAAISSSEKPEDSSATTESGFARLRNWLARALEKFSSLLDRMKTRAAKASPSARAKSASSASTISAKPSLFEKLAARMRNLAARMMIATRLASFIGKRQAAYISRMMEMFERGDIDEALRHAIPIAGEFESRMQAPSLRVPIPRTTISISPLKTPTKTSIGMGDDLLSELRKLYRASFERLEAQGRIEEAAFVLAELLQANEEAVAFLERHNRLKLAAEIAEARGLAPGLVVRLWFLAGDRERAIRIARRMGAFTDAVLRLERTNKKDAEVLRLLWATTLASAGNYASAVEAIWPVEAGRRIAEKWIDQAIETGGVAGARMLARKIAHFPASFEECGSLALTLLEDESAELQRARRTFAFTLMKMEQTPQAKAIARAAVRALARDAESISSEEITPSRMRELQDFAADTSLRTDVPPLPAAKVAEPLTLRESALWIEVAASDAGTIPATAAAFLPNGRMVVAMGEAGVRVLTREGKVAAHIDQPAHRLVVSDHGDRVIAMARRGEVWRLARIDLLALRSEDWCEARVDAFASDYDGSIWFTGEGENFYAIDALSNRFDALWRVPDIEGKTVGVARTSGRVRFLTYRGDALEDWNYELPMMTLRSRTTTRLAPDGYICTNFCASVAAEGFLADQSEYIGMEGVGGADFSPSSLHGIARSQSPRLRIFRNGFPLRDIAITIEECRPLPPVLNSAWVASPIIRDKGALVTLVDVIEGGSRLYVSMGGSEMVSVRLSPRAMTVADDRGRLIVVDLETGATLRDIRHV